MNETNERIAPEASVRMSDLMAMFWRRRVAGAVLLVISLSIGTALAVFLPEQYRARTVLTPVSASGGGPLGSALGGLGGLAALSGLSLGSSESSRALIALEILGSRAFVNDFAEAHGLRKALVAANDWNEETDTLVFDASLYDAESDSWLLREGEGPTPARVLDEFERYVGIEVDATTGFVTLSVDFYSPQIAQRMLEWLVADINGLMRDREIGEASTSIEYLTDRVDDTPQAELRTRLYDLMQEQMERIMLARARTNYVFDVVDPPASTEEPVKPDVPLILFVSFLLALFSTVVYVFCVELLVTGDSEGS